MQRRIAAIEKNGLYSIAFSIISYLLVFVNRKVFLVTLGSDYLGYEGLFSNIFSILGTAEAGMTSLIYYALYKEYADANEEEISRLMTVYKLYYTFLGVFIFVIGTCFAFFLPNIITENTLSWSFVYKIYFIQLFSTCIVYFLSYGRALFTVALMGYICIRIDAVCFFIATLAKIGVLYVSHNYFAYLFIGLGYNIISNVIITLKYQKSFSSVRNVPVTKEYIKKRGFFKDLSNMFVGTIAGKVYSSTDSFVISKFINISIAGLYSNYFMLSNAVDTFVHKIVYGISPATGNFVNTESKERIIELYKIMNILFYFLGVLSASSFAVLVQPFIVCYLGETYLLPYSYVMGVSANMYINWNHYFIAVMRGTQAHFHVDRGVFGISAIMNVFISIALVKSMGISGVIIGTVIGGMGFWIGRAYVVHKYIIHGMTKRYILTEIMKAFGAMVQIVAIVLLANLLPNGLIGLLFRGISIMIYFIIVDFVLLTVLPDGKLAANYIKAIVRQKIHKRSLR